MSKFTDLLNNPFALHRYLVITDPVSVVFAGSDISVTSTNTFSSTTTTFDVSPGDTIVVTNDPVVSNNGDHTVVSSTSTSITVSSTLTNHAAGQKIGIGKVQRVYLSSGKFITVDSDTPPAGAPALLPHIAFDARLDKSLHFERSIYSSGAVGGNSIPGYGAIEAMNLDGELDDYRNFIWSRRPVWVLLGGDGFRYSDYGLIFAGLVEDAEVQNERLVINARDFKQIFEVNLQDKMFAGSGSYEGGIELKDKPKPKCFGKCYNIEPVEVGVIDGRRTWVFHDAAVAPYDASFHQVFDRGVALTYTAGTPTAGQWTLNTANAAIIIGGDPDGPVTANVKGDATLTGYVDDVASIIKRIVLTCPSKDVCLVEDDIKDGTIEAFQALEIGSHTLADVSVGLYFSSETTVASALDRLVNSVGGFYGFDRETLFTLGRFDAPSDTEDLEVYRQEILDLARDSAPESAKSLEIKYAPIWSVMTESDLAGIARDSVVVNGDFDDSGGWTVPSGWVISGGKATATNASTTLTRSATPIAGLEYRMVLEVTVTSGSLQPKIGTRNLGNAITATGTHTFIFNASTETSVSLVGTAFTGYVNLFEIRPTVYWFFTEEFKTIKLVDASTFSTYEDTFESLIIDADLAAAEVARQFALFSQRRDVFSVKAKIKPYTLDVGDTVKLYFSRWGLKEGKNLVVLSVKEDAWFNEVELTLWG